MRVLSLSRPWPWIMLHPDPAIVKLVENRSWKPSADVLRTWIALHAARSWDPDAIPYWESIGITGFPRRKDEHPSGEIQGAFFLDRVLAGNAANLPAGLPESQRRWFFGAYGWIGTRSKRLSTPIPHVGGQGLRHLPADTAAAITAQLTNLAQGDWQ